MIGDSNQLEEFPSVHVSAEQRTPMWYVYFSRAHPSLRLLALRHELQILYSSPGASQVEKMLCVAAGVNADECNVQEQGEGELNQVQADALLLFLLRYTPHTLHLRPLPSSISILVD